MWPNMNAGSRQPSIDLLNRSIDDDDTDGSPNPMQREVDDLIYWLESEQSSHSSSASPSDPWKIGSSASTNVVATSPLDMHSAGADPDKSGFEDDFSDFVTVTAPPDSHLTSSSQWQPRFFDEDEEGFGEVYTSLGSVSDFGAAKGPSLGSDRGPFADVEEDGGGGGGDGVPTEAEIRETSAQIFGWPPPSFFSDFNDDGLRTPGPAIHASSSFDPQPQSRAAPSSTLADDEESDDDPGDSNFDFSHVLSTLEGMKAQIAEMTDEGEKRKMAARVALGLVYGAGNGSGMGEGPMR